MMADILRETTDIVRKELGEQLDHILVRRVVIGLYFTAVKLSTGHGGACTTPKFGLPKADGCTTSDLAMPDPGNMRGRRAIDVVADGIETYGIRRVLALATLNALAHAVSEKRSSPAYECLERIDALDAATVGPQDNVLVVGAETSFLRGLKHREIAHVCLETGREEITEPFRDAFRPFEQAPILVPKADVLLITSTALIADQFEPLIALARPDARVAVAGPGVTMLPDAFFRRRIDMVCGARITYPDVLLDVLMEGGTGDHFFGGHAVRIAFRKRPQTAQPDASKRAVARAHLTPVA